MNVMRRHVLQWVWYHLGNWSSGTCLGHNSVQGCILVVMFWYQKENNCLSQASPSNGYGFLFLLAHCRLSSFWYAANWLSICGR